MASPNANSARRLKRLSEQVSGSAYASKYSDPTSLESEEGNLNVTGLPVRTNKTGGGFYIGGGSDVLRLMDFDNMLSDEERQIRWKVREIMQTIPKDVFADLYERAAFDKRIVETCKRFGPAGLQIQGHGSPGLKHTQAMLFALEMARVDVSFATFYLVHCGLAMQSIAVAGSEEQRAFWLPQMSRLEKIGSFALTEPEHGSDATNLNTTARRTRDGWILNGRKRWIGNGTFADVNVVWAKETSTGQIHGFIVERHFPGLRATKIERKIALRIVQNADMYLEDCFVPDSHRLEKKGFGASTRRVLEPSRALVCALCAGALLGAYENAFAYCMRRKQFNKALAGFQLVQERLMRALGLVQASLLLVLRLGRLMDEEKASMGLIALLKGTCSRFARDGVALCREVQGGNGIVLDFSVAKFHADIEALYTYEGTYDINMLVAAREFTGRNAIV